MAPDQRHVRLAIMQPYLFPYVGYFQLLSAVDRFVLYDDVPFIKQGWINRNRILAQGRAAYFTVPVQDASSYRLIRDTRIDPGGPWRRKLLRTIALNYGKAPGFGETFALLSAVMKSDATDIATLCRSSLQAVCRRLDLPTEFVASSTAYGNEGLSGQARVLDICRRENARTYVNMIGGSALYDAGVFASRGITLRFLQPRPVEYMQFGKAFVPWLSILDVLMFNPVERVRSLLAEYDLV